MDTGSGVVPPLMLFAIGFPLLWLGIFWLIGRLGGWHSLHRQFATTRRDGGDTFSWVSGKFSFISSYNNCLTVSVTQSGVRIEPMLLFRFGHEPLFIPWGAIERLVQRRVFLAHVSALHVTMADGFHPITLYGKPLSDALEKHAPPILTKRLETTT